MSDARFLPGVPVAHILKRLDAAGGNEAGSGKLDSPESSAALAINAFGWFVGRPERLSPLPGTGDGAMTTRVDVEFCARFPWSGGRHPWLDAVVEQPAMIIGVESKRFEPFRDRKTISLSPAYDRPVWGDDMRRYERMRDRLRNGETSFTYLDAAQLVKHAFGLRSEAVRRETRATLYYVFAEPRSRGGHFITDDDHRGHRAEIAAFGDQVAGDEVSFLSSSYREWLDRWSVEGDEVAAHAAALSARFEL